jgi:hypothetical protein
MSPSGGGRLNSYLQTLSAAGRPLIVSVQKDGITKSPDRRMAMANGMAFELNPLSIVPSITCHGCQNKKDRMPRNDRIAGYGMTPLSRFGFASERFCWKLSLESVR